MTARATITVVVLAVGLGALFNAEDLRETAERQPYGWQRTVAVSLARPLYEASRQLRLDRPRAALDLALGHEPATVDDAAPGSEGAAGGSPSPTGPPSPGAGDAPAHSDRASPSAPPTATSPSPQPLRREVTAGDPMRLYIGGDSMVGQFGPALEDLIEDTGVVEADFQYEFESGLTRPDFVDWPARLDRLSRDSDPDVMVLLFGGNDAQPLKLEGTVHAPEAPEWQAEYRRRVADLMAQLTAVDHDVYWVGMPIARDDTFRRRMRMLNGIYASEAEQHDTVTFVSSWELFTGPDGRFSEYLPDDDGDVVDMRLNDGIHLTTAGAHRLARVVADVIAQRWRLPPRDR